MKDISKELLERVLNIKIKNISGITKNNEIKFHTEKGKEYLTVSKYIEMLEKYKKESKQ